MTTASLDNCKRLYELSGWGAGRIRVTIHIFGGVGPPMMVNIL